MKDSDGDGFIDVLEVFAGTLPGDASSRPLVTPQFLMQSLEKAGGLEIYKPRQAFIIYTPLANDTRAWD